jgi:hypothetical protein
MEEGQVAEVRGVIGGRRQELESGLADIVMDKIKDLSGGDSYFRRAEDMKYLTEIERKIVANPEVDLTDSEIRFLYEMDCDIQGFGHERDPRINEIRTLRDEWDLTERESLVPETIRDQLKSSFEAYKTVAELLGAREVLPDELQGLFELKDAEWSENGVYDYLAEQSLLHRVRYCLVATPSVEASEQQIVALAEAFSKNQPLKPYISDSLFRTARYSGSEWSGRHGGAQLRFSLIPSSADYEIDPDIVENQIRVLQDRQAKQPNLQARVPSPLDAFSYWYALRAQGDKLEGYGTFNKTNIRHFDMEPKVILGQLVVPDTFIDNSGKPILNVSDVDNICEARIAVG